MIFDLSAFEDTLSNQLVPHGTNSDLTQNLIFLGCNLFSSVSYILTDVKHHVKRKAPAERGQIQLTLITPRAVSDIF